MKRDCACPRARHQHGTQVAYNSDLCRCQPCRDAHAAWARYARRQKAYGRHVPKSVPNVGARRRVQALATNGWSMHDLSRMLGWHPDRLQCMFANYDGISPANHYRIAALYDRLWDTAATGSSRGENSAIGRTLNRARRNGWAPPLAWDDDTIDDPNAEPQTAPHGLAVVDDIAVAEAIGGRRVRLDAWEQNEAIRLMSAKGVSDTEIGNRLGMHRDAIAKRRERHHLGPKAAA